jgi:hypothetical protein
MQAESGFGLVSAFRFSSQRAQKTTAGSTACQSG